MMAFDLSVSNLDKAVACLTFM